MEGEGEDGFYVQVTVEKRSPEEVTLQVEVEKDHLERYLDTAYKKLVRKYRIPGFRPGKAPRPIFERFVGRSVLLEEALEQLLPEAYQEAIKESGIEPYEEGTIEAVEPTEDGVQFRARVYLKPAVVLPDLGTIRVDVPEEAVTEAMIEDAVQQLRLSRATLVPAEEVDAESLVRVEGEVDGENGAEPFRDVEIRLNEVYPEIREGLVGAKVGEERSITYHEGERERRGRFKVLSVHRVELPEVDEDFARQFGHESLEELRQELTKYIEASLRQRARAERAQKVLAEIVAKAEVQVPRFLVEREKEHLRQHHLRPGEETSEEALESEAQRRVREMLVAARLVEQQGIRVTPEEVASAAVEILRETGAKKLTRDHFREAEEAVLLQKLTDMLADLGREQAAEGEPSAEAAEGQGDAASQSE